MLKKDLKYNDKKKQTKNTKKQSLHRNSSAIREVSKDSLEYFKNKKGYSTNKITGHGYHRFYDIFLQPMKNHKFHLLELGVNKLGSLLMWTSYFKNAKIFGFDKGKELDLTFIKPEIKKNIKLIRGDHSKIEDLKNLVKITGKCKLIIDDGSHVPEHQLLNFNYLFKHCLKPGGVYIIEDIETSYWTNGHLYNYEIRAGYKKKNNVVQIFKDICDIVNYPFLLPKNKTDIIKSSSILSENINEIIMISFGTNCIIIKKRDDKVNKEFNRVNYKFKNFL